MLHLPHLQPPHESPQRMPDNLGPTPVTPHAWLAPLPLSARRGWAPPSSPACLPLSSGTSVLASSHAPPEPLPPA